MEMRSRCLSLPVLVVLLVIAFVYYTTVFIVTDQWLSLNSASGLLNAIVFTTFTVMSSISYALAIVRDPGRVPSSYMPDIEDSQSPMHEVKRKDHHCVWINNCVGLGNYKAFFLFLLYAVIACVYAMVLLVGSVVYEVQDDEQQSGNSYKASYVLYGTILVPLTLALSILLVWHMYLLSHNKTTIEYHEGVRAMWLDEKAGRVYRHPYDLGVFRNIVLVLGPYPTRWICPTATGHIGSGLQFQTFNDSLSHAPSISS